MDFVKHEDEETDKEWLATKFNTRTVFDAVPCSSHHILRLTLVINVSVFN